MGRGVWLIVSFWAAFFGGGFVGLFIWFVCFLIVIGVWLVVSSIGKGPPHPLLASLAREAADRPQPDGDRRPERRGGRGLAITRRPRHGLLDDRI